MLELIIFTGYYCNLRSVLSTEFYPESFRVFPFNKC